VQKVLSSIDEVFRKVVSPIYRLVNEFGVLDRKIVPNSGQSEMILVLPVKAMNRFYCCEKYIKSLVE